MTNLLKQFEDSENNTSPTDPATAVTPSPEAGAVDWSFKKIDVPTPAIPHTKHKPANPQKMRIVLICLAVVLILIAVSVVTVVIPAQAAYNKGKALASKAKELGAALKSQNLEDAKGKLPETRKLLEETKAAWNAVLLLKILPVLKNYHADVLHSLNAGGYGLDALDITIATVEPYADLLGLKGKSSFVAGSADERIQTAVKTLDKVTPKISEIGDKIDKLKKEIDSVDPNRYPEKIGNTVVRQKIIDTRNLINDTTSLFLQAQPLLEVLPKLLGQPDQKRYLVLFQNDKELRPTGGFLTAYAIFKVQQGKLIVEKSENIYELDDQITVKKDAPPEILTYHKGVYYFNIRDSNLSPDFLVSMKQFQDLYPHKFDFDGIVTVDTHVLVEAIKILGSFQIAGREFSAENDKRCDCPKVIYELEDYSTRPVAYVRAERKDILGTLLLQIMQKALGVSPKQYWGQLFQMALSEINQKHILAFMVDAQAQKGIESLNMGGRIADGTSILGYKDNANWDYTHINDTNFAGAKSNLFVSESVKTEYEVGSDSTITKSLTIDYKNPAPASDCNLESGGLCLNGILRNWVRIYVPKGATLVESKGSQSPKDGSATDLLVKEDLGKTVFEGFLTVRPLGSAQLTLKYKLPFKKSGDTLNALFQKQPGTQGNEYTIVVNGKQKDKFSLLSDKLEAIRL